MREKGRERETLEPRQGGRRPEGRLQRARRDRRLERETVKGGQVRKETGTVRDAGLERQTDRNKKGRAGPCAEHGYRLSC